MSIECPVCLLPFDQGARLPKVMPCGHTACLHCLQGLQQRLCPMCRKAINQPSASLASNFFLLGLLEQNTQNMAVARKSTGNVAGVVPRAAGILELDASKIDPLEVLQLIRDKGVVRLKGLRCSDYDDPVSAADVLRAGAPLLEELQLLYPNDEHVALAHAMPRLRRLFVRGYTARPYVQALPALTGQSRLDTFSMDGPSLPLPLLQALLRAHGSSIKTLQLCGWKGAKESTADLWIGECGLTALRRLLLSDGFMGVDYCSVSETEFESMLKSIQSSLPRVQVLWDSVHNESSHKAMSF